MFQLISKKSLILPLILAVAIPLFLSLNFTQSRPKVISPSGSEEAAPMAANAFGVIVEKSPSQSKLTELGVATWPKWGCGPSKFPWSFSATETMYLLEGKVNVEVDGKEGSFTIGANDFVVFPKGMKVTWDVIEAVSKHSSLEE